MTKNEVLLPITKNLSVPSSDSFIEFGKLLKVDVEPPTSFIFPPKDILVVG